MSMGLKRLLRFVGFCAHPTESLYRAQWDGTLMFVCSECDRAWPAITRTPQEYKRMQALAKRLRASKRHVAQAKRTPADVLPMRPRKRG